MVDCTGGVPSTSTPCTNGFDISMFPDLIQGSISTLALLEDAIVAGTVISPSVDCGSRGFIEDATTTPVSIHCGPDTMITTAPTVTSDMNTTYTILDSGSAGSCDKR